MERAYIQGQRKKGNAAEQSPLKVYIVINAYSGDNFPSTVSLALFVLSTTELTDELTELTEDVISENSQFHR